MTEAKDTVMKGSRKDSILEASHTTLDLINNLCEAQAEISFKAGIREVVEWIKAEFKDVSGKDSIEQILAIPKYKLRRKLKVWGIEE